MENTKENPSTRVEIAVINHMRAGEKDVIFANGFMGIYLDENGEKQQNTVSLIGEIDLPVAMTSLLLSLVNHYGKGPALMAVVMALSICKKAEEESGKVGSVTA